jgi:hypothetical protein
MVSAWLRLPLLAVGLGFALLGVILSPISQGFFVLGFVVALILSGLQMAKAFIR